MTNSASSETAHQPFGRIPTRTHVRFEMEIQPHNGWRQKWRGWLVEVCQYDGTGREYRYHAWPFSGPAFNGRYPAHTTACTREKLEEKLRAQAAIILADREAQKVERVPL